MKNKKVFLKIVSLVLVLLTLLPLVLGCKARPLAQTKLAKTEVGTVGTYSVLYEELYFLAHNYCEAMREDYGNDTAALSEAVWDKVNQNITTNYAILKLCESEGLVYDESALKKDVEAQVKRQIEADFNGSRGDYFASQQAAGLTDNYVRFVTGVDILYNRLDTEYKTSGVLPNTDEELFGYIKENFIHTWHIAIFINNESEREAKYAKAQEALAYLEESGSMYELVKSKYNEDLNPGSLRDAFGTYFPKGVMDNSYEDAAFSLDVNKHSGIVEGMGENNNGQYVKCFYIIERLPVKDAEIDANFNALSDMVSSSLVAEKMESVKATLTFVPNDFAKSLDITNLEAPKNGADYILIMVIALCVLCVGGVIALIILIRSVKTKKFHKQNKLIKRSK